MSTGSATVALLTMALLAGAETSPQGATSPSRSRRHDEHNATAEEPYDDQRTNRESLEVLGGRNKDRRLYWIKQEILTTLGRNGTEPSPGQEINNQTQEYLNKAYNTLTVINTHKEDDWQDYPEKRQSFYPSCEPPRNTEEDLWYNGDVMNLHFELTLPTSSAGNVISVVTARLKLFKLSQDNVTGANNEDCLPSGLERIIKKSPNYHVHDPGTQQVADDKQIRVSVYWYTRSLKKNKVRRKLLDSQMVSLHGESWTEWNILAAIKAWKETGKNFGLAVEVEDEDRVLLPASKYFAPMNCSKEASTSRPIPRFIVEAVRELDKKTGNDSYVFEIGQETHPMIDLCTKEIPEAEMPNETPPVEYHNPLEHRVRHHHRREPHHQLRISLNHHAPSWQESSKRHAMVNVHNSSERDLYKR